MSQMKNANNDQTETVIITVIYDNNPFLKGLKTDWGFACLVEVGKTKLLFDTGDNGSILLNNLRNLGIDPQKIDIVFLSHFHHDHTGGLKEFLNVKSNVKVFYPQSFPEQLIESIKSSGAMSIPVSSFQELKTNIFSLGELGDTIPEQSLAVRTSKGIVVITGCAHPGIIEILQKAKRSFPEESIYIVLGGFHLHRLNEEEINDVIQKISDLEIQSVAPAHCTGSTARKMFEDVFGTDYIEVGAGRIITIGRNN